VHDVVLGRADVKPAYPSKCNASVGSKGHHARVNEQVIDYYATPGPLTELEPDQVEIVRSGHADPASFGVFGTENWGPGELRGNAMRDLASVARKVEMLPWDEWGPMEDSYNAKIRLINKRGFGHPNADHLAAMIHLCLGGITVPLPTQT
jgi:hypothetical protein